MLFSPNNGILLQQLSPPDVSWGNDETLLHYDMLSQYCFQLQESPSPIVNKPVTSLIKDTSFVGVDDNPTAAGGPTLLSPSVLEKRDGHSKIFTAQGPRDRRVRLSKDVARKFFDLQDLLGFNRASKTLDWLLKKSKPAIKELMMPISTQFSLMYPSSESENLESNNKKKRSNEGAAKKKRMRRQKPPSGKRNKTLEEANPLHPLHDQIKIKEMRAKARARARERTKGKQFLKEIEMPMMTGNQARTNSWTWSEEVESCKTSSYQYSNPRMNGYSLTYSQPNLIISRESCSNFSHWSPNTTTTTTTTDNWDISISSAVASSTFHPLTNFSTSSSSPVVQVQRKPFDLSEYNSYNNQGLMWS